MKKAEGMKLETGYCKYCNQARTVQVGEEQIYDQTELNRIATSECDCDLATKAADRENRIRRAEDSINKITKEGEKSLGDFLKSALPLITEYKFKKLSINVDGIVTYALWRGNEGQISIQRKETISQEDEIE